MGNNRYMARLNYDANQTICNDKIIVLKDIESCSIRFNNAKQLNFYKVIVDGGLIRDSGGNNTKKCDYIIYTADNDELVIYVELKGNNINLAVDQLESTIRITKDKFQSYLTKKAYISSRSSPKTQFQKRQRKFQKDNKVLLYICKPESNNKL